MNKKRLIISDILVFVLLVGIYLTSGLAWFFSSEKSIKVQTSSLAEQTYVALNTDSNFTYETSRYRGLFDYEFSYYPFEGGKPIEDSMGDISELSADFLSSKIDHTYFEFNANADKDFCYCISYVSNYNLYFRIGISVPYDVYLAKNFLIWGSVVIVLIYGVYFVISIGSFNKSLSSLKKQITRLRSIVGVSSSAQFTDSMEFYASALRDARKRLEKELNEANEKAKETDFILSSFTEGIILFSHEKKIRLLNKKAAEIFDLDYEDSIGRPLFALSNGRKVERKVSTVIGTGIRDTYYETIGSRVYQVEIEPLLENKEEMTLGAAMLLIDVTDEFNSAKMKRDFFANASHELKSPLASILGYQEMIQQGILTEKKEIEEATETTIKEARRMNKIIVDMLELSSLENETLRPIVQLEVGDALSSIIKSEEILANEFNVTIVFEKQKCFIKINEDDFDKLFRNLIENAIRYNKKNGYVYVKMDGLCVQITDTGIGIEEKNVSRIFERFYRVDKARSRKDGGTGLGLSIVKYICEYYGYKIEVKSVFQEGTTFSIYLKDNIVSKDDVE